jgi:hypothetical protein
MQVYPLPLNAKEPDNILWKSMRRAKGIKSDGQSSRKWNVGVAKRFMGRHNMSAEKKGI